MSRPSWWDAAECTCASPGETRAALKLIQTELNVTRSWVLCARVAGAPKPLKCIWLWVCRMSVVVYLFYKREEDCEKENLESVSSFGPGGSDIHPEAGSTGMGRVPRGKGSQGTAKLILPALKWLREGLCPQATLWGASRSPPSLVAWLGGGSRGLLSWALLQTHCTEVQQPNYLIVCTQHWLQQKQSWASARGFWKNLFLVPQNNSPFQLEKQHEQFLRSGFGAELRGRKRLPLSL